MNEYICLFTTDPEKKKKEKKYATALPRFLLFPHTCADQLLLIIHVYFPKQTKKLHF